MSDLIDRDAAIAFVDCGYLRPPTELAWSDKDVVDMLKRVPSAQPESCEGCKWENAFGYGECGRCRRRLEDMYERETCENE